MEEICDEMLSVCKKFEVKFGFGEEDMDLGLRVLFLYVLVDAEEVLN